MAVTPTFTVLDKFNPDKAFTQVKFGQDAPLLEVELNEMQKILVDARAEILRQNIPSGFLAGTSAVASGSTNLVIGSNAVATLPASRNMLNYFEMRLTGSTGTYKDFVVNINGNIIPLSYSKDYNGNTYTGIIGITLPDAPTFGNRDDLVFLEAWFEEKDLNSTINKFGGENAGNISNDLMDSRVTGESSRRVQLKWRIRTVSGVDFSRDIDNIVKRDSASTMAGWATTLQPQGGLPAPITYNLSTFQYGFSQALANTYNANHNWNNQDAGLWIAGDGTSAAKTALATADGYVYAIPLFRVKRRNNAGYRADNLNGATDFLMLTENNTSTLDGSFSAPAGNITLTMTAPVPNHWVGKTLYRVTGNIAMSGVIVAVNGNTLTFNYNGGNTGFRGQQFYVITSERPDGKFSNIIDQTDIVDLRHKVSLTGFNLETLLEDAFDKLYRGVDLNTKDSKISGKERYALHRAPYGIASQLTSTKVKGDDLVERDLTNLFGKAGALDGDITGYLVANGTYGWDSSIYDSGKMSLGVTGNGSGPNSGLGFDLAVDVTKNYLFGMKVLVPSGIQCYYPRVYKTGSWTTSAYNPNGINAFTGTGAWKYIYLKIPANALVGEALPRFGVILNDSTKVAKANYDSWYLYQIDDATYNSIDVDPNFTGDNLLKKFPFVNSYQTIAENLIDTSKMVGGRAYDGMFTPSSWSVTPNTISVGQVGMMVSQRVSLKANTDYTVQHDGALGLGIYLYTYSGTDLNPTNRNSPITFNTGSGTTDFVIGFYVPAGWTGAIPAVFLNPRIQEKANVTPWYVPSGRWNMPYDIMNGDTKLRYEPTQQNRKMISDRQVTDTITEVVDNLRTPQRHITVVQATEGTWAVGDKISISSEDGVITGVIDSDTAIAKVVKDGDGSTNLYVDDVSKFAVNDTLKIYRVSTDNGVSVECTVSAIDTVNKVLTLNVAVSTSYKAGDLVVESTVSSSSPVVTSTGIAGNWTNLGTKLATYTITTAPTTTSDKIKVQYSVAYPAGKGIQQVADMYEVRVNSQRHIKSSDGTITIKANFSGKKALADTDRNPHTARRGTSVSLATPPSFTGIGEVGVTGAGISEYMNIAVQGDNTQVSGGTNGTAGNIGQFIFSFDLIRAISDRLGNEVFADCVTLADKVAKAKTIINQLWFNWWGYGVSVNGNKSVVGAWNTSTSSWYAGFSNSVGTQNSVTKQRLGISSPIANYVDSNGLIHFIAYTDAAGQIANPTTTPTLSQVSNAGSTLTAQTYYVVYTWVNASGETMGSTEASLAVTAGNNLQITVPTFPANVTSAKVYVGTATGAETLQGTISTSGGSLTISADIVSGAALPASNTTAVIQTSVYTDYVDIEITLNPAETGYDVYSPENQFPMRVEHIYQEGENMLPPFNAWYQSGSVLPVITLNSQYSFSYTPSADYQTIGYEVEVVPNTSYTLILPADFPSAAGFYVDVRNSTDPSNVSFIRSNITSRTYTFTTDSKTTKVRIEAKNGVNARTFGTITNLMLTPGTKLYPFIPITRNRKNKRFLDFLSKVGGSTWENPHRASTFTGALATTPSYQTNRADWDAATPQSSAQYLYDQVSKQDGTIKSSSSANPGAYAQHMFEFDLSHLGMSLSELKRLIRKITVNWTGFGQGDNGGALTYGATVKVWHEPTQAWTTTSIGNTASTSTFGTGAYSDNAGSSVRITKDQKIYVLVHSTYPATPTTAANPAVIYTDYVSILVEFSDEVDFVKGNIVKVMKETKEFKTDYAQVSYTSGIQDTIELFYSYLPYQGTGNISAHQVLTKPENAMLTTIGTGSAKPSDIYAPSYFVPIPQLPLGTGLNDYQYTYEKILFSGQYDAGSVTFDRALQTKVPTEEILHATSSVYRGIRVNDMITPTGTAKRGMLVTNNYRLLRRIKQAFASMPVNMLAVFPYLALIDNEIYLVVITAKPLSNNNVSLDGTSICAIDTFRLTGRPLIRGGI